MCLKPTVYLSVHQAWAGAVHIPLLELESRVHELPPPYDPIQLISDSLQAYWALGWLHARGRRARLVEPPADADPTARYRLWRPNAWLEETLQNAHFLPALRSQTRWALDLGCGSGREAVYLADLGWQVVAVDRLPEALQRGRDLQRRYAPDSPLIEWLCTDLEKSDWQPDRVFDLITLFYFYSRTLIHKACSWLSTGGALLVEAFTVRHRARFAKPASDLRVARPNELPALLPPEMRVVQYSEGWRVSGQHTARLWAVRE